MAVRTSKPIELTALDRQRLRAIVRGLVIALGYLQHWLDQGGDHPMIRQTVMGLDAAIDALNEYLNGNG